MIFDYGFSVIGKSHEKMGTKCQDASKIKKMDNGWVIAAIADGVGSAKNAQRGAKIAVDTVVEFCEECLPYDYNLVGIKAMMLTAYNYALKHIHCDAQRRKQPFESYDTTLTMVIYDGKRIIYGHSGDGAIIGLTSYGNYVIITRPQKGEDLVSVQPLRSGYKRWIIDTYDEDLSSVLLMTDGILETFCPYQLRDTTKVYVPLIMFFADPDCFRNERYSDEDIRQSIQEFLIADERYDEDTFYKRLMYGLEKRFPDEEQALGVLLNIAKVNNPIKLMRNEQDDKTIIGLINLDSQTEMQECEYYTEPDWQQAQDAWNRKAYPHLY